MDLNEDCENDDHQSRCDKDVGSLHHLTGGTDLEQDDSYLDKV